MRPRGFLIPPVRARAQASGPIRTCWRDVYALALRLSLVSEARATGPRGTGRMSGRGSEGGRDSQVRFVINKIRFHRLCVHRARIVVDVAWYRRHRITARRPHSRTLTLYCHSVPGCMNTEHMHQGRTIHAMQSTSCGLHAHV
eukprot:5781353-Prymnesium_polylepis.1